MTAKRGSLWKTSWNRSRGHGDPPQFNMNFLVGFNDAMGNEGAYQSALAAALGAAVPFWFGAVGVSGGSLPAAARFRSLGAWSAAPFDTTSDSQYDALVGAAALADSLAGGPLFVSAVLFRVTAFAPTFRVEALFNRQQWQNTVGGLPYVAPAQPLEITFPSPLSAFHGGCGGAGTPTDAEMLKWFDDLKSSLSIQPIPARPGLSTDHLYRADPVGPAPDPLPDLGAGPAQNLPIVIVSGAGAPAPTVAAGPVMFSW